MCVGARCLWWCSSSSERDPPVSEEDIRRERTGRSDDVATDAANQHIVLGPNSSGRAGYEGWIWKVRCDSRGTGVGTAFISSWRASRNLIANLVRDIRKLSIGLVLALYVAFVGTGWSRLDGVLTVIVMTYSRLGNLFVLLRNPERLQGPKTEFDAQMEKASYRKLKAWMTQLLQYILQQNRSLTGEDKSVSDRSEVKKCGGCPCWLTWPWWCRSIR